MQSMLHSVCTCVTFGGYRFGGHIDGCSALGVVYEVSLDVVLVTTVRNTLREIELQNDYCNGCGLTDHGCGMTLL